jgi:hypothetical protein
LQVGSAGVVEQFGQVQTHGGILIEQEFFEHRLVDRDHLLHVGPGEVHGGARIFVVMTAENILSRG